VIAEARSTLKRQVAASTREKHPEGPAAPARQFPWRRLLIVVPLVAIGAAALYREIDVELIHAWADRLNGTVAFVLLAVLPLLGFPASLLHVAAGIRFGSGLGLVLVAASILFQLLVSYALVHLFRAQFSRWRWVKHLRRRIPKGAHPTVCIFAVLLPGAPYAAINYTLPVIGVAFRTYVLYCLPLHTLRATVTVLFGGHSDQLTGARLAVLAGYAILILGVSWWTFLRLRTQLGDPPAAANDRTQPA
jgi:uncharacterized membrane protein YdjX (TVP38/TMEM64 family)